MKLHAYYSYNSHSTPSIELLIVSLNLVLCIMYDLTADHSFAYYISLWL